MDGHLDICDVWTLHLSLDGVRLYPRFRVLHQQSAIPYVAVRVICCVCLGAAPHRFTPRRFGCYFLPRRSAIISSWLGRHT